MTIRDRIETKLLGIKFAQASRREVDNLHAVKSLMIFGWAKRQLMEMRGGN